MLTLLKLGGSLITDKKQRATLRPDVLERIAQEIAAAQSEKSFPLLIGHGSGSFGHFEAKQHQTIAGVQTAEQWHGFARVSTIAAELNFHVATALQKPGVPVMRFQPSASAIAEDGVIISMAHEQIQKALDNGLVPLVYGDVAFDSKRGGTIVSTETVFAYLVKNLPVSRILLLGEVDGVWDAQKQIIPSISPKNFPAIQAALEGSGGVDVTGGMETKVSDMLELASTAPYPEILILNGLAPNRLTEALLGKDVLGTWIARD
jgi:isopentenyl phosphate kinase